MSQIKEIYKLIMYKNFVLTEFCYSNSIDLIIYEHWMMYFFSIEIICPGNEVFSSDLY